MMRKRIYPVLPVLLLLFCILSLTGCKGPSFGKSKKTTSEPATIVLTEQNYALVFAHPDNGCDRLMEQGFSEVMTEAGRNFSVARPSDGSVKEQRRIVEELIASHVSSIAIEPVDAEAMKDVLKEALDAGIDVCSFGGGADPESRDLQICAADEDEVVSTLLDAVLEVSGGAGQWAILSTSSSDREEADWVSAIKEKMEEKSYENLQLRSTAYVGTLYRTAYDQTRSLLQNYPDIKVICLLTPDAMRPAAQAVRDAKSKAVLTGFCMPSQVDGSEYEDLCPVYYLWDAMNTGRLCACVSYALHEGYITGELDEEFTEKNIGTFRVEKASDNGTEVTAGHLIRYTGEDESQNE